MFKTIVVGTDGSETAQKAVEEASELALATGASVHIVRAVAGPGGDPEPSSSVLPRRRGRRESRLRPKSSATTLARP
jgi:nucleotide-binding universal stress UspA family protein